MSGTSFSGYDSSGVNISSDLPQTQQSSTGSGDGMIGGIIGTGVDTGALIGDAIAGDMQMDLAKQWRKEDLARWHNVYDDQMKQQNKNNIYRNKTLNLQRQNMRWSQKMSERGFEFQKDQFEWGQHVWGKEFGLRKEQWEHNKSITKAKMKQNNIDRSLQQIINAANRNNSVKENLLKLKGI